MKTSLSEIVRLKKHKNAETNREFDWDNYWLQQGDNFLSGVTDHLFEKVASGSGLTISDHPVVANKTYCIIPG